MTMKRFSHALASWQSARLNVIFQHTLFSYAQVIFYVLIRRTFRSHLVTRSFLSPPRRSSPHMLKISHARRSKLTVSLNLSCTTYVSVSKCGTLYYYSETLDQKSIQRAGILAYLPIWNWIFGQAVHAFAPKSEDNFHLTTSMRFEFPRRYVLCGAWECYSELKMTAPSQGADSYNHRWSSKAQPPNATRIS